MAWFLPIPPLASASSLGEGGRGDRAGEPRRDGQPEDVIPAKLQFYQEGGGDKHLRDIAGILRASASELDGSYLDLWAARLGVEPLWREILRRLERD